MGALGYKENHSVGLREFYPGNGEFLEACVAVSKILVSCLLITSLLALARLAETTSRAFVSFMMRNQCHTRPTEPIFYKVLRKIGSLNAPLTFAAGLTLTLLLLRASFIR